MIQLLPSFNAGELSPLLDARTSLEKYQSGCRTLQNFIILPYGGAIRRPGTEYIRPAKYANKRSRLVGFNFSTTTSYILEFFELGIRFFSNGQMVESAPGTPFEVATPYVEAELRDLQYVQINDIVYLVHPNHSPRKLSRVSATSWTLAEIDWTWPALLDENVEETTLTASATTGTGITITASAAVFSEAQVGAYFAIAHRRDTSYVERSLNGTVSSSALDVLGDWELTSYGTWNGTLNVQRSYDGTNWETLRTYSSSTNFPRNVSTTGREEKQCKLRVSFAGSGSSAEARLEVGDNRFYGLVKITGFTSATSVTASVVKPLYATTATKVWAEGAFSAKRGFPRTVCLHEQRLIFGGTKSRPLSVWGSVVDDFENFRYTANDDGAFLFALSASESNPIQWMVSQTKLLIGTAGDEWTLGASDESQVLSPTNVQARRQSSFGSKYLQARIVNEVVIFTQRQGRKVRELTYSFEKDGWVAPDLTILAEHITKGELLECAFQQQPDAILWGITGAGLLVGMTYERDQNVVGWHRHTTGTRKVEDVVVSDEFESVAAIYGGSGADEVWFVVKRTVNGNTVRYVERLRTNFRQVFDEADKPNWWYVDCAKVFTSESPAAGVTGFSHLEGRTVSVLGDGAVQPERTVAGGGMTLQRAIRQAVIGLPYESVLQPMKLDAALPDGAAQGRRARIHEVVARLHKSLGGEYSTDGAQWDKIYARDMGDRMDASPPVFTGDRKFYTGANYGDAADLWIRQVLPLPLCVLALIPKWNAYGE